MEVWFQDEARVGQRGTITRVWAPKGTRPRVVQQQQFTAVYVFGAVCPAEDKAYALVMPEANNEAMQHHLDGIAQTGAATARCKLTIDCPILADFIPKLLPSI